MGTKAIIRRWKTIRQIPCDVYEVTDSGNALSFVAECATPKEARRIAKALNTLERAKVSR
jgi:hypothetical protein